MALRGSPMGILLIASGVVLLNLAYTGRGHDVWTALTQGGTANANTSGSPGDAAADSTGASITPLTVEQASNAAAIGINNALTNKIFKRRDGTSCPTNYWTVRAPGAEMYCVIKGDAAVASWNDEGKSCGAGNITGMATDNNRGICVHLNAAGQASDAPMNIIPHPVGFGSYERMSPSVTTPDAGWGVR